MRQRGLLKVFLLGLVTLGIYYIYWLVKTRGEMLQAGAKKIPSVWMLFLPVIAGGVVLGIGALLQAMGADIHNSSDPTGMIGTVLVALGGIIMLGAVIYTLIWFYQYSQAVVEVTKGSMSLGFTYGMFLLLNVLSVGFIWNLMVQNAFNKVGDQATGAAPTPPAAPSAPTPPTTPTPPVDAPTPPSVA